MTDVVVVGAGAAGLMCALTAGQNGRSVVVLERAARIGQKILISGGGRCNFTNLHTGPENYISARPDFCKSALARYRPADFIALVERHRIAYHEKKLGQLFCDGSSREIVAMLQAECVAGHVSIRTETEITDIAPLSGGGFRLATTQGSMDTRQLVLATGGLSLPKLGATDFAFRTARQFGLKMQPTCAALVPFTLTGEMLDFCQRLSGVSLPCSVSIAAKTPSRSAPPTFTENLLFTHRGLSGPAMLQASSYWQPGDELAIDLMPGRTAETWIEEVRTSGQKLETALRRIWPERFAAAWAGSSAKPLRGYSAVEWKDLAHQLHHWAVRPAATEGYATAEVTVGGVDTGELNSKTMEARSVPGLYFIGEAVDVTGWLGGYNFQWAWASGHACGSAV